MNVVEVGFRCNNACVFCAQGGLRTTSPEVAVTDGDLEGESVAFVGGEPTIYARLADWVRRARNRGASSVLVQTNGRRLSERRYVNELAEAGVTAFEVSLHGPSEAVHDYHTGVAGSFKQTVAGLRRVRAARIPFSITTVVTRSNFRHVSELVRLVHALGARAMQLSLARDLGAARSVGGRVVPAIEMVRPHLRRAMQVAATVELPLTTDGAEGDARGWFAGIGTTEPVAATAVPSDRLSEPRRLAIAGQTPRPSGPVLPELQQGAAQ